MPEPPLEPAGTEAAPDPQLASFVVRFVVQSAPASIPARQWHGVIRHVQSDAERYFTRWDEAVAFIAGYVQLQNDAGPAND